MKKFINIRNILILLVIIIAIGYIIFMKSKDTTQSKTSDLFYKLINKDCITMELSFNEDNKKCNIIYSSDIKNNVTFQITELFLNDDVSIQNNTSHIKNITIRKDGKTHSYQLNYDLKNYIDFGSQEDNNDITDWIENFNKIPSESKYYTKKYEEIDEKQYYTEYFPEKKYKFYYDGNELKYIKQNDGMSGNADTLYEVKFEENLINDSLLQISNDFTLKK